MNQDEANAVLSSIISNASLTDDRNFTYHATQNQHVNRQAAATRALNQPRNRCGYFQHDELRKTTIKKDAEGFTLAKPIHTFVPTGLSENVSPVEYVRLVKAFFRGPVVATPDPDSPELSIMRGPIPAGFTGYTNEIGTANYSPVTNMRAVVRGRMNWQLVTVYPVT